WQAVGFMHGVLNTDNMSILGLTLDYGPFGFMDAFDPAHICNHTDQQGRYAYHQQPNIGLWNCYALGQAMLPLIGSVEAVHAALEVYQSEYDRCMQQHLQDKLGLTARLPDDGALIDAMFSMMHRCRVDFTQFFRRLGALRQHDASADEPLRDLCLDREAFDQWAARYRARLARQTTTDTERRLAMNRVNPNYVLRNYLAQVAIERAEAGDFTEIETLRAILARPFDDQPEFATYAALPPDWAAQLEVSCSS
ncbi:MAG: protein adenylyltransferase SelO family protein, partial [Pseudomonadota bacterium]|nr:protein adenylyltransferase SelO family protein [Pseudomonadota bacterium]